MKNSYAILIYTHSLGQETWEDADIIQSRKWSSSSLVVKKKQPSIVYSTAEHALETFENGNRERNNEVIMWLRDKTSKGADTGEAAFEMKRWKWNWEFYTRKNYRVW